MGTNPLGRGTTNLSVNVPQAMKDALQDLADASGMPLSAYLRRVLKTVVDQGTQYTVLSTADVALLRASLEGTDKPQPLNSTPTDSVQLAVNKLVRQKIRRAKREGGS